MAVTDLDFPFRGRWVVRHSPADRVPSHGTDLFASTFAIDFVPTDDRGRTAPVTLTTLLRSEPPQRFPGFGRAILSPCDGLVVSVVDGAPDHDAHRGVPSLGYALTQRRRASAGWRALAGNHVLLETAGLFVALCHLQRGSIGVQAGQSIGRGARIGRCGNSGNSTEPHVHVQAMDGPDPSAARPVRLAFRGGMPRGGDLVDA